MPPKRKADAETDIMTQQRAQKRAKIEKRGPRSWKDEEFDRIPDLHWNNAYEFAHYAYSLRRFRPHHGIRSVEVILTGPMDGNGVYEEGLDEEGLDEEGLSEEDDEEEMEEDDDGNQLIGSDSQVHLIWQSKEKRHTRGLNIMIVLLRHLLSLGFKVMRFTDDEFDAANGWAYAANKDIGWTQEADLAIKMYLIAYLAGVRYNREQHVKQNAGRESSWPVRKSNNFKHLFDEHGLAGLFRHNAQFRLVSSDMVITTRGDSCHIEVPWNDVRILAKNELKFNNSYSLSLSISGLFHPHPVIGAQYLSLKPRFLLIDYAVRGCGMPISELRVLELEAPGVVRKEVNGEEQKIILGTRCVKYRLCAVVRIETPASQHKIQIAKTPLEKKNAIFEEGQIERIRTYSEDGEEIVPAEIGQFEEKEPEAAEEPWSVQDEGRYILFYRSQNSRVGGTEMRLDAPEYREREWVKRDR